MLVDDVEHRRHGLAARGVQVDDDTLRLSIEGLTEEGTWTVDMAAGAMTDIYGNAGQGTGSKEADATKAMTEQLVLLLTAFFSAPALQKRTQD